MKRSTHTGQTVVYRYGCPSWFDLDAEIREGQVHLAHRLRNYLVGVHRRHREMRHAIELTFPALAAAHTVLAEASAEKTRADDAMKAIRLAAMSTVPSPAAVAEKHRADKSYDAAKQAISAVREDLWDAINELSMQWGLLPAFRCAAGYCTSTDHRKSKGVCPPTCHHHCPVEPDQPRLYDVWIGQGLGWGTWNDIVGKFATSKDTIRKSRQRSGQDSPPKTQDDQSRKGRKAAAAELQFHSWNGSGTLTVQVQGVPGNRRKQWELVDGRSGAQWLSRPRRVEEKLHPGRRTLRVQIGRARAFGPRWVELPVVVHRPLPDGADVSHVRLTRRTVAGQPRLSAQFTVLAAAPHPQQVGEAVHVDFTGKSKGAQVGVSVARISTRSGSMPPLPHELHGIVTAGDWWTVVVPAQWRDELAKTDAIRADRNHLLDLLRPGVCAALAADPELAARVGFDATAARLMGFGKYMRLAEAWPTGVVSDPEVHELLLGDLLRHYTPEKLAGRSTVALWRMRDQHLWSYEAHMRQQVLDRRADTYRKVAAWVAGSAQSVGIAPAAVADRKRVPDLDREDTHRARGGRRVLHFAAQYELEQAIRWAATRRGVHIEDMPPDDDEMETL